MTSLGQFTALEVNGERLSLADVLRSAGWREQLGFLETAAEIAIIRQQAAQRGIEVFDDELQQAADDFRASRGLYEEEAVDDWLADNHLTFADWERLLEDEVITRKLRDALTGHLVEQYFAENKPSFDGATISQIMVRDEGVAKELRAQIYEEGVDFHKLARTYSIDGATRLASGYVGLVMRKALAPEAETAVFGAEAGRIVGPIRTDQGWLLIRVHTLHPATLDDATRERIKSSLFEEWLSGLRGKAQISVPLLAEIEDKDDEDDEVCRDIEG